LPGGWASESVQRGRDAGQWLRHLYEESRPRAQEEGIALPSFDEFWQQGCWNTARRSGRRSFSPIFAPIRSAIRSPRPPARLNSFPKPSPGLAIANARPSVVG
jgi:biotin/methionine sulfoxide reductase